MFIYFTSLIIEKYYLLARYLWQQHFFALYSKNNTDEQFGNLYWYDKLIQLAPLIHGINYFYHQDFHQDVWNISNMDSDFGNSHLLAVVPMHHNVHIGILYFHSFYSRIYLLDFIQIYGGRVPFPFLIIISLRLY